MPSASPNYKQASTTADYSLGGPTGVIESESATAIHEQHHGHDAAEKKKQSFIITLEVYYSRAGGRGGVFQSARPYLREAVILSHPNSFTFRSFLRHGLFEKRPELKYRDEDVALYQTPKGTNLLTLLDQPIVATLPDLLAKSEQQLFKVIIKGGGRKGVQKQLTFRNPHGQVPAWPKTRLEESEESVIPEEDSVHVWIPRAFALDDWGDWGDDTKKQKRRKVILSVTFVLLVITIATAMTLGVLLFRDEKSNGDDPNNVDTVLVPGDRPTLSPTRLAITSSPSTGRPTRPSKLQQLQDIIVSQVVVLDESLLRDDSYSPERLALNWLAGEDEAVLTSNLCSASPKDEDIVVFSDDDGFFPRRLRRRHKKRNGSSSINRKVAEVTGCNDDARVIRRYALAVFYMSTMDISPSPNNPNELAVGESDDDFFGRRRRTRTRNRRVKWMNDLNFLSEDHECLWHRSVNLTTASAGGLFGVETQMQGVICTDAADSDGHIMMGEGKIALHMNENQLMGELPPIIFQIQNLTEIRLGNNELTGEVSVHAYSYSVERIDIHSNNFTGSIDFLLNFPNVTEVHLDSNQFSGEIPSELGQMVNLHVLTLGANLLNGSMPDEICNLRREYELEVLEADCGGTSPKVWCECCTSCSSSVD